MPTNVLLLPLLAGYWFVHNFYYTRYRAQRLDGYRLLLESALTGVGFAIIGRLAAKLLTASTWSLPRWLANLWISLAPVDVPFLGSATMALSIALIAPFALNRLLHLCGWTRDAAQRDAIARSGNGLLKLLHRASNEERAVSITLSNRKVYVGMIVEAPNLEPHDRFVTIIPLFSGHRNSDTLELTFTVEYLKHYLDESLDWEDFIVVLPLDSVQMASFFDQKVYQQYFVGSPIAPEQITHRES
jgi:hypothetical protein